jgi:subtilisin
MAALHDSHWPTAAPLDVLKSFQKNGSNPSTICDGKGHGYFYGDRDSYRESLLYKAFY